MHEAVSIQIPDYISETKRHAIFIVQLKLEEHEFLHQGCGLNSN